MGLLRSRELVFPPNVLSLARIPLAAAFAAGVAWGRLDWALAALLAAGVSDVADGWLARRLSQETATGRIVDPLADKLFMVTVVVALVASSRLGALAALLMVTREIVQLMLAATLLVRHRGPTGLSIASTASGKMTTILQTATAASALLWLDARPPLALATAVCGAVAGAEYWISAERAA